MHAGGGPAMSRDRCLLGALIVGAAAAFAFVVFGGSSEGTVVAKIDQGAYGFGCQMGSFVTSPVAVPVWGACSEAECWPLVVRDGDGNTSEPCVSREEYDRTQLGSFFHERNR